MIESDWPSIQAVLVGVWPRRELQPASLYLRLLEPFTVEEVRAALRSLAATSRYAPSPSELLQALKPGSTAEDTQTRQDAYTEEIAVWIAEHFPELIRERFGPHPAAVTAVIQLHHKHATKRLDVRCHGAEFRGLTKAIRLRVYEETVK